MAIDPVYLRVPPQWSVTGVFDDQLRDPSNFGLGENAVGLISAVLTGLSILLLTDLCFRVVVRSRRAAASSHTVYRRALFSLFANPLDFVCAVFEKKAAGKSSDALRDATPAIPAAPAPEFQPGLQRVPRWQRVLIAVTGVLLLVAQLALIFLATNRVSVVHVDKAQIPAFDLTEDIHSPVYAPLIHKCTAAPLVTKPGFVSLSTGFVCAESTYFDLNSAQATSNGTASVQFRMLFNQIVLQVKTGGLDFVYSQEVAISIANGTQYISSSPATRARALQVVPRVFARYGIPVMGTFGEEALLSPSSDTWFVGFWLNTSAVEVPAEVLRESGKVETILRTLQRTNNSLTTFAWNTYLIGISRSALGLVARSRAHYVNPTTGPFLDEYDGPLVQLQRPWLSVGGCVSMCASALLLWVAVAKCAGWGSGLDERVAWVRVFETIRNVNEFSIRPEEVVHVDVS